MSAQYELEDLSAFTLVVRERSFSAAARSLGVPKSTISRRVARLEEALGVELLHRTTRKVHATEAGTTFYDTATRVLVELEEAQRALTDSQDEPRGVLRVTAPQDIGVDFMSELITEFITQYPDVQVSLELTQRVVDLTAEGFDVAIRASARLDASLFARRLLTDRARLFASPAYLERRGEPTSLDELAGHECILAGPSIHSSWSVVHKGKTIEVPVRGHIAVNDFGFARRAALAGAGITYLPTILAAGDVCEARLKNILPEVASPGRGLHVVYASRRIPAKTRAFVDAVVKNMFARVYRWPEDTSDSPG